MTQDDLALASGVSLRTIHVAEHGKPTIQVDVLLSVLESVDLDLVTCPRRPPSQPAYTLCSGCPLRSRRQSSSEALGEDPTLEV